MARLSARLLKWYNANKRSLPWRGLSDPYAIWVSEIMLQQTRVEAVIPYFERWMARFPDVSALAKATEQDVLKHWEGLGYYARARSLRKAAQVVLREHGGQLPSDTGSLRRLPGIGRYTAGAIASIAFRQDEPALDGNIRRVLARVFNVTLPAKSPQGEKMLWELAEVNLPKGHAGDFNQALMDLGATICLALNPRCAACPVNKLCEARRLGLQGERPVLEASRNLPHWKFAAAVIVRRGRVLMEQRPSKGLLGGMWQFPNGKVRGRPATSLPQLIHDEYGLDVTCLEPLGVVHHGYSHFTVDVHAFLCEAGGTPVKSRLRWIPIRQLHEYPMGRIDRQIAGKLA